MKIRLNRTISSFLGALVIRMLATTWRIEWRGLERLEKAREMSGSVIFAIWHGRLLVHSWTHRKMDIQVLASENYDGDLMGRIIARLGFGHLKGSTSRGGTRAIRELKKVLRKGKDIGLTIDGPRGPIGVAHQGAVEVGRLAGSAVLPMSNAASRRRLIGSWDRFQVPLPFSKIVCVYGEPFIVPREAGAEERERIRESLQDGLNRLTAELDREMGHSGSGVWPHEDN